MALLYSIRDWDRHFEVSQSRKVQKWTWVATPCKHDGKSFRRIMLMPDGPAIYGAWMLIVQVAAKCPVRGVLKDSDGPLTAEDLAIKTGCPVVVFENAINVLASKNIGWLLVDDCDDAGSDLPLQYSTGQNNTQPTNQPNRPPPDSQQSNGHGTKPDTGTDGRTDGIVFTWEDVGGRLAALNVSNWRQAIAEARICGCTPEHAIALIDYGLSHGYGPGGIVYRLKRSNPQTSIERCWPVEGESSQAVADKQNRAAEKSRGDRLASEATALIKACRKRGIVTDEAITAELSKVGLEWPR